MTMPAPTPDANAARVYEPSYPRIVLMATDGVGKDTTPINWGVGDAHPFMPKMRIVAMYLHDNVIEIYSFDGAKGGIRELVPLHRARLIREEMPIDIYGEELRHAELGFPDDDVDDDDEFDDPSPANAETVPPPAPAPEPTSGNGQVA
jgi:hypothetical protein